jgi:hypothetical protein
VADGTRVTCEDVTTGEKETTVIKDNYVVITDGRYYVAHQNLHANGTAVITLKKAAVDE